MRITNLQLFSYQVNLKKPLTLSSGTIAQRDGFVLQVTSEQNQTIHTDVCPLPGFHPETAAEILEIFPQVAQALVGSHWSLKLLLNTSHILSQTISYKEFPSLYFAIEMALLCHLMPKLQVFQDVKINALAAGSDHDVVEKIKKLKAFSSIKIKSQNRKPNELLHLIEKVEPHLTPKQKLRIDFNRAYSLKELAHFCGRFPVSKCEYLEEPLKNPLELLSFSSEFEHPLAYDESLDDTSLEFLLMVPTKKALIVKPTRVGSLQRINFLYSKARLHNLKFIVTSCFESGLGHLMVAQLAHYLAIDDAIGLDTYNYLKDDILKKPLNFFEDHLSIKEQNLTSTYLDNSKLENCYDPI